MDFFNISFKLSLREDREDLLGRSGNGNRQTAMWGASSVLSYVSYSRGSHRKLLFNGKSLLLFCLGID